MKSQKKGRHLQLKRRKGVAARLARQNSMSFNQGFDGGYLKGFQTGYDSGYDDGYNQAHGRGYGEGYQDGLKATDTYQLGLAAGKDEGVYEAAESWVEKLLPPNTMLADVPMEKLIEAGLGQYKDSLYSVTPPAQIGEQLLQAVQSATPYGLIRLGDGELLTMAQETAMSDSEIRRLGFFLPYAGVEIPDRGARDLLLAGIRKADAIGIPLSRKRAFQPLFLQVLRAHGMDYRSLPLTHSLVNYELYRQGYINRLLEAGRVLVVGNLAHDVAEKLRSNGNRVSGAVHPVRGMADVPRVLADVEKHSFDFALVSAGIAAVPIVSHIRSVMGKVAIDFGHMADRYTKGGEGF
ncbi:hypothetical protein DUZ99_00295 [Xylanibacillus composti]|uniref:GT-D fold-like domain-containing protein n=1 Tax=Xylanibacillus composti TaxID=1572762 RepID=A0A8J4M1F3_9BACL|nr:GT-D fold domain-containing glycosyltransferase [Xylanibacillus composti]MDT9723455.1 hypothetical protein [Xylanibacillus composti]GIQ68509.1 hypothetical protein XYCOK13_13330 [Xylanibacillus composti]